MSILVTGGTGTVGSQVVEELLKRKADVSVLTRDAKKPLPTGVKAVEGNLLDVGSVRRVFKGFDHVFLLNPVSQTEASEALMAISGMRNAGVKHVVYMSVHHADAASWLPHFGSKVGIEDGLKKSGSTGRSCGRTTSTRTTTGSRTRSCNTTSTRSRSAAPASPASTCATSPRPRPCCLTEKGHAGQTYDLVGPRETTGEWTAKVWSDVLGRPIAYGGDDLDAWEKQFLQYMPDWMVFDFREMYHFFQTKGLKASKEALDRQTKLIGHAPRPFEEFARESRRRVAEGIVCAHGLLG